ncbi:winged helix-turn-helix transcriptional regulator [Anaerolineae bacterium CFX7]|nr:winged helix-turn-helix transcriptional regulator [Anaerolineae bacterium CFX7]
MLLAANAQLIALEAKLFHGLADPSRLAILRALLDGPLTVNEIVARTGLSQSNTSNHLACLRGCGLTTTAQNGRFVLYALSDERIAQTLTLADEILATVAKSMYECVHFQPAPRRAPARAASTKPRARGSRRLRA